MKNNYGVSLPGEVYAELCHEEPIWGNTTYCGKNRDRLPSVECNRWPDCGCQRMQNSFPGSEYISKHHICLPMYPGLNDDDLKYVVESLSRTLHQFETP